MDEILTLAKQLENLCEERDINYGIFFSEQPHTITGSANLTLEEITILMETMARNMPVENVQFMREVLSLIVKDKSELKN